MEFRDLSFEMGEFAALLSIYFENKLHDLAIDIRDKGSQAIKPVLTPAQIAEDIEAILAQGKDSNDAKMVICEKYNAAYDHLIPKKDAHDFFELIKKAAENARTSG